MIYFDNAATTKEKPSSVKDAVRKAFETMGNPGRAGHSFATTAANMMYYTRVEIAEMFGMADEENIVFTSNATHSLNIAINNALKHGGHVVTSGYEHNSVMRPIYAMNNVRCSVANSTLFEASDALTQIKQNITPETRCVVVNHMSNVFGNTLPIYDIDKLCASYGIQLVIDASQSAGILPIDCKELKATSFVCMPGHKSLYGPSGTGILICCKGNDLSPILRGGTGSNSQDMIQPDFLPDVFESGTPNFIGIAGLREGVKFVKRQGIGAICEHERELAKLLANGLGNIKGLRIFYNEKEKNSVISITAEERNEELSEWLTSQGFCIRDGLHCAPIAHKCVGTVKNGTIRVSFSVFNTKREIKAFISSVNKLLNN